MKNNIFKEKLKFFLKSRGITQKMIAEKTKSTTSQVNNLVSGRDKFGLGLAKTWGEILNLDPLWLMTQGEKGTPPTQESTPTVSPQPNAPDVIHTPILNLDSRGGFLPNDAADIQQYTIGTMPFSRSIAHEGDVVVPVYGDSMSPRYPSGSFILIRPLPQWREYLELGRSYVLELADWRRIIKIIRKGSDTLHYLLDSYNVDFESDEIAKSFINSVWLVVASINRENL